MSGKLTVYYDASCPYCEAEMCAVKARDAGDALALVDCSAEGYDGERTPDRTISRDAMMKLLHAKNERGEWLIGIAAYQAILEATGFKRSARFIGHPRVRPVLDRLYAWVARHRHRLPRMGFVRRLLGRRARDARAS